MKTFRCTKCCNFGPGDPCVIRMDKETHEPTFCPSDDGKYPGAEWVDITQPADSLGRATQCLNCGGFYTNDTGICPQCNNIATPGN